VNFHRHVLCLSVASWHSGHSARGRVLSVNLHCIGQAQSFFVVYCSRHIAHPSFCSRCMLDFMYGACQSQHSQVPASVNSREWNTITCLRAGTSSLSPRLEHHPCWLILAVIDMFDAMFVTVCSQQLELQLGPSACTTYADLPQLFCVTCPGKHVCVLT
jgi:hypothetical protein